MIVTVAEEYTSDNLNDFGKDSFMEALLTDKFVSSTPTNYDVDAFIRESRGYE